MGDLDGKFEMVTAIDFGTTYSGYAYSYRYDKENVYVNGNWKSGSAMWKVPTAILFDDQKNFVAFGDDAEDKYCHFAECDEEHSYYFFHRFKMSLQKEKDVNRNLQLTAANNLSMKAIDVFSGAIRYLKDHMIESVNGRNPLNKITVEKIRWVLTVPAIWSDAAKQFMREAAEHADIPSSCLLIALEPECASLYIKTLPAEKIQSVDMNKIGAKYMVLDNGGGTIDTSVHEIIGEDLVKEIYKATGGAWGSTEIDKLFSSYLSTMLSQEVLEQLMKSFPTDWVEMLRDFEKTKRSIDPTSKNDFVLFTLTPGLTEVFEDIKGVSPAKAFQNKMVETRGAKIRGTKRLQIPTEVILEMIKTVVSDVKKHAQELLNIVGALDFIIMVGGFSNSPILKEGIVSIAGKIPVIVPEDAELSVVKGAVKFGFNPTAIGFRRSRKTYGISKVIDPFIAGLHPERLKIVNAGGSSMCSKIFDTLVTVDEEVDIGKTLMRTYLPAHPNQRTMRLPVCASNKNQVSYTDEDEVITLGSFIVPMSDLSGDMDRQVKLEVCFGNTEIRINGIDVTTGTHVSARYDFLAT